MTTDGEARLTSASSDAALVRAAQAGSAQAFTVLVERYHAPVLRYLTRQIGSLELAEDLVQETFLDAYRSLRQLDERRTFAAWLYEIARNNLRHAWRGQRGQALWSLDWLRACFGDRLRGSRQPDPANASAARDLIQQALDTLSPALREALLLHVLWGFTTSEISQLLHISPAAAGRRISRAQEQFRRSHAALERGHDGTLP